MNEEQKRERACDKLFHLFLIAIIDKTLKNEDLNEDYDYWY